MEPFDVIVLLFPPPCERIWVVRDPAVGNPEDAICLLADRLGHHHLNDPFEIRSQILHHTRPVDLFCPNDEGYLIRTAPWHSY